MQYCSWKLHFTALNWSNKIWQDAAFAIHYMKQTENFENLNSIISQLHYHHATYYSCTYVVNFIHEHFMETDLYLQVSQHQASLKYENFTLSYHSYTTLVPQNILQLQRHFSCTLYSINNLRFKKIRVSWNGELPLLHVPSFKMFLTLPKFEWTCFSWPNFDLGCCNLFQYL